MQESQTQHPQVAEWLVEATKLKETVLARLDSMPETQRVKEPGPGEWPASSVVEHLILFEENVAGPWRQKLLDAPSTKTSFKSSLLSLIVRFVVSKTGVRVPTLPELEPKEVLGADALRDRWNAVRERLVAALPADTGGAWIVHPALGPLSSEQIGKLLAAHIEHHLRHWPSPKA
jgi:hypothetical protein